MTAAVNEHGGSPRDEGPAFVDIYELLGVTADASPVLARELHHERVERLRDRLSRGDAEAIQEVETLNEALALMLDARRRAAYNRQYHLIRAQEPEEPAPRIDRTKRVQIGAGVGLLLLTIAISLSAWELLGGWFALGAAIAGFVATIAVIAWPRAVPEDPFAILGLTRDASRHHVDLAYELLAQEQLQRLQRGEEEDERSLLGRLRGDRQLVRRLELLDRARIRAKHELVERYVEATLPPPGTWVRARRWLRALPGTLALYMGDAVVDTPGLLWRQVRRPTPPAPPPDE